MAKIKKISNEQFTLDCINKAFEIIGSDLHWNTFEELKNWSNLPENKYWFDSFIFTTQKQYDQWRDYFMTHYYDWGPKRTPKYIINREFGWFALSYGFRLIITDIA